MIDVLMKGRPDAGYHQMQLEELPSAALKRGVTIEILLPSSYFYSRKKYPFLVLNDGQDINAVRLKATLNRLTKNEQIADVIAFGIHAGDRMQEYGVASHPDFKKRGSKAKAYTQFMINELMPLLAANFRLDLESEVNTIGGFSLGALSAFDIGWHHPEWFQRIGVFSGSLWWRSKGYDEGFDENKHRILHNMVRNGEYTPGLKFWFEAGTLDEHADRNHNGIIDSIDDTLDLIAELIKKDYRPYYDIEYCEIKNGKHNQHTWAKAMPEFLKWAFGK
ncbi:MAG: esterase family protein [Bacteroidetes bacterium]|nr:esterase family protein [Bacteroidota bacterium]